MPKKAAQKEPGKKPTPSKTPPLAFLKSLFTFLLISDTMLSEKE